MTDLGPPPGMENAREALASVGSDGASSEISSGATAWEEDLNAFLELDADTPDWRAVGEAGSNTQERSPDRTRKL